MRWVLAAAVVVLFAADLMVGAEPLSALDSSVAMDILLRWRLPKALVAVAAGAGLAACGLQMQTLFRNPLAGPYVLGVSSGASLGVAIFLMGVPLMGASEAVRNLGVVGAAWLGGAAVLLIVMAAAARLKDIMAVLILGMMFGAAATALVEVLQFWGTEASVKSFAVWTMGALGHVTAGQLWILLPVVAAGLAMSAGLVKSLDILLLGEDYARTMGMSVQWVRGAIFLSTVLLACTLTAFCGPIGFVGIAVPHLARMIFRTAAHRVLMPASILLGAALMLVCDIVSSALTLPLNTVTALLGIPVIIIVIVRNRLIF
jgi:iron complex transport system permease protein